MIEVLAAAALIVMLVTYCWWKHEQRPGFRGFEGIPAMSFEEVKKERSFVGKIESKGDNVWPPPVDGNTGVPIPGAVSTECVVIYLATHSRGRVCIYKAKPTPEDRASVSKLKIGKEYTFPDILTQQ